LPGVEATPLLALFNRLLYDGLSSASFSFLHAVFLSYGLLHRRNLKDRVTEFLILKSLEG